MLYPVKSQQQGRSERGLIQSGTIVTSGDVHVVTWGSSAAAAAAAAGIWHSSLRAAYQVSIALVTRKLPAWDHVSCVAVFFILVMLSAVAAFLVLLHIYFFLVLID